MAPDPTKSAKPVQFRYRFAFGDGREREFLLRLDPKTLALQSNPPAELPEWTLLEFNKCSNCPLGPEEKRCPIAVNLVEMISEFGSEKSFEEVTVTVETAARTYLRITTLQKGISSMLGIVMSTSGCPILDRLRPNVRFHLPFATGLETFVRSISMHLIGNFFASRRGKAVEPTLDALLELYGEVTKVNKGFSARLLAASESDANVNALVILHTYGDGLQYYVFSSLEELEADYDIYLKGMTDASPGTAAPSADQPDRG
jgi:hypothetical protein